MSGDRTVELPEVPSGREPREPVGGTTLAAVCGCPEGPAQIDGEADAVPDPGCERPLRATRAKREDDPARAGPLRQAADTDVDRVVGPDRYPLAAVDAVLVGQAPRDDRERPDAPRTVPGIPVELIGLGHVQHRPPGERVEGKPLRIGEPCEQDATPRCRRWVAGRIEPNHRSFEWPADEQRPLRRPDRKPRIADARPHLRRPAGGNQEPTRHVEGRTAVAGVDRDNDGLHPGREVPRSPASGEQNAEQRDWTGAEQCGREESNLQEPKPTGT